MKHAELIRTARAASPRAYAPYSHFSVGAALECADGTVFTGCNVENAAYGEAICAERTAVVKAVSEGYRSFRRIAVWGGILNVASGEHRTVGTLQRGADGKMRIGGIGPE